MPDTPKCPHCGSPLPNEGWEGLCPKCVVRILQEAAAHERTAPGNSSLPADPIPLPEPMEERGEAGSPEISESSSDAPSPFSHSQPIPGRIRYFGDYVLLEEIARGGMGVVYKARQVSLNRLVAVKMILSGEFAREEFVRRFRVEAEAAANLHHPNIVSIHEVGEHEGQHYFSMDYVEGKNLAEWIADCRLPITDFQRIARYLKQLAEAIHYAHERGILHRDLKPSNVLIDENDQPRITDFGLAKRLTGSQLSTHDASQLTLTGQVLGSPSYMPPEQAEGKHRQLTIASDIYSLGAILYHLLTGRPPFVGETLTDTLQQLLHSEPPSPRLLNPGVPRDLETICLKCLYKEPHRRYATAQELADELGRFVRDEPILARPVGRTEKAWRWCRRNPTLASFVGATMLLLLAVTIGSPIAIFRINRARLQAQAKESEAKERLRDSYLAQARANRWSGRAGRRFDGLEVLKKAAKIRPSIELRNEAIAAMALVDVHPVRHWPTDRANACFQEFDDRFTQYVRAETNGSIALYRTRDDQLLMNLEGAGLPSSWASFSPNGRFLAARFEKGETRSFSFKVYDLSDHGKPVFQDSGRWVRTHCFSADSRNLAVVWGTREPGATVAIYDAGDWREIVSIPVRALPTAVTFNPSGDLLAVSSTESPSVNIHNSELGGLVSSLSHSNGVHWVSWDSTGSLLAAGCADRHVYLWDMSKSPPDATRLRNEAAVVYVCFNHTGSLLVTADWHNWAKIWNVQTGKELLRWPDAYGATFSEDGRWMRSQVTANRLDLLQCASAEECPTLHFIGPPGGTYGLAYSPDGRIVVSTHKDGLRIWDAKTSREMGFIPRGDTRVVQFARDGHGIVTAEGSELFWWPITANKEGGTNHFTIGPAEKVSRQSTGLVNPTNRLVVVAGNKAYVIDAQSVRIGRRLTTPQGVYSAALSPDGHHFATWSLGSSAVEIWDADDGHRLTALAPGWSCLRFSPEGRWLVTGSYEEYLFWETASWTRRHSVPRCSTGETHGKADFSPDGKMVALSMGRGEVALFDATTFAPLATFEAPEGNPVSCIAFSPDGAQMAVGTQGFELRLWDLRLIRQTLAAMKLDWELPPLPPPATNQQEGPFTVTVLRVTNEQTTKRGEFLKSGGNGLLKVLAAADTLPYSSWLGPLPMPLCRQNAGQNRLVWQTEPVPTSVVEAKRRTNAFVQFRLAAGTGYISQPQGKFTLKLGGQPLLDFDVTLRSATWHSPDGSARMIYTVMEANREDSSGLLEIEVAAGLLKADQPAEFEVVGSASNSQRWFGIYLVGQ